VERLPIRFVGSYPNVGQVNQLTQSPIPFWKFLFGKMDFEFPTDSPNQVVQVPFVVQEIQHVGWLNSIRDSAERVPDTPTDRRRDDWRDIRSGVVPFEKFIVTQV
jgi:hypothetical protein